MRVKITKSFRYAIPGSPHLPLVAFVEGTTVEVVDKLGASIVSNGHGHIVNESIETAVIEPESKDQEHESSADTDVSTEAYDNVSPKKQRFVDEYLIDRNGTAAAIRAGYSENNAENRGIVLLDDAGIQAAIAERTQ